MNSAYDFWEAFPGLVIKGDTKEIADIIQVEKAELSKSDNCLYIYVQSHQWIHKKHLYRLEREIKRQLYSEYSFNVIIRERFRLSEQYNILSYLDAYRPSIEFELSGKSPVMRLLYSRSKKEISKDGCFCMILPDTLLSDEMSEEFIDYLNEIINVRGGYDVKIRTAIEEVIREEGSGPDTAPVKDEYFPVPEYSDAIPEDVLPEELYGIPEEAPPEELYGIPEEALSEQPYGIPEEALPEQPYEIPEETPPVKKDTGSPSGKTNGKGRKKKTEKAKRSLISDGIIGDVVPIPDLDEAS